VEIAKVRKASLKLENRDAKIIAAWWPRKRRIILHNQRILDLVDHQGQQVHVFDQINVDKDAQ
jgi:hypothetical protein